MRPNGRRSFAKAKTTRFLPETKNYFENYNAREAHDTPLGYNAPEGYYEPEGYYSREESNAPEDCNTPEDSDSDKPSRMGMRINANIMKHESDEKLNTTTVLEWERYTDPGSMFPTSFPIGLQVSVQAYLIKGVWLSWMPMSS